MKTRVLVAVVLLVVLMVGPVTYLSTQPSFNGTAAGCGGSTCHTAQAGILATTTNNLTVSITLSGAGSNVAGELVDGAGTVVAVNNKTSTNPFTLTAPGPGTYTVNAGYKSPNLRWDSKSVVVGSLSAVEDQQPLRFALKQNYPNPFNPSTTIEYEVPEARRVSLVIWNSQGQEVARLGEGHREPGRYLVSWNARDMASGVYLCTMRAGEFVASTKLLLVR